MSWNEVDLRTVSVTVEPVALGEYTFALDPGAKFGDNGRIEVTATITDGTFAGRRLFFSYPDPAKYDWSPRVLKRLINALGVDVEEGQTPLQVLQNSAGLKFSGPVKEGKKSDEYPTPKHELDIFKVKAAA